MNEKESEKRERWISEIKKLGNGECWHFPGDDCAEIWCIHDSYLLFEAPKMPGCNTSVCEVREDEINKLIEMEATWT